MSAKFQDLSRITIMVTYLNNYVLFSISLLRNPFCVLQWMYYSTNCKGIYSLGNIYKQKFKSNCYPCMALINGYWLIQCSLTRFVCLEWFSVRPATLVLNHPRTFSLDFLLTYLILFVGTHHAADMHSTGLIYSPSCKVFNDNMLIVVGLNFVKLHICPVETDTCAYISIAIS